MIFEDAAPMVTLAADLGIDDPEDFVYNVIAVVGPRVAMSTFILHCIRYLIIQNKKLKEQIAWMTQEKNS